MHWVWDEGLGVRAINLELVFVAEREYP